MKIGLVGTYDVNNFGDCMFPELYQHLLQQEFPQAKISLYSPTAQAADILSFDQVKALPATVATSQVDEDLMILTGGETITYGHSTGTYIFPLSTFSAGVRLWLGPVLAAANRQNPQQQTRFFAHCVGATKIPEALTPAIGRILACSDFVSFRDTVSLGRFSEAASTLNCSVDPMFLLSELLSDADWQARAAALLPDGLKGEDYFVAHITAGYISRGLDLWAAEVAKVAKATGKRPLLLPICHFLHDDLILNKAAAFLDQLGCDWSMVPQVVNVKDTAALIAASSGYIGTSLHGAVSAVTFGKPLAVLAHSMDGKHEGTLVRAGVEGVVSVDVSDLADLFLRSAQTDLPALKTEAMARARSDFQLLIDQINAPAPADRATVAAADIDVVLAADRARTRGAKDHIHRLILSSLRRSQPLYDRYKRLRLSQKMKAQFRSA